METMKSGCKMANSSVYQIGSIARLRTAPYPGNADFTGPHSHPQGVKTASPKSVGAVSNRTV